MIDARARYVIFPIFLAAHVACQPADRRQAGDDSGSTQDPAAAHIIEVIARDYAFEAPDEIPSGWTTFVLRNEGREEHFLLLSLLPEGKTLEDYKADISAPFDSVWRELQRGLGKAEAGAMLGQLLPEWWGSVQQMGGPGFVAAGGVAQTTVNLQPGTYVLECYVKSPDGVFHAMIGMVRELTVTAEATGAAEPVADLEFTLSNFEMARQGEVTAGEHTVAVHIQEHPQYSLGNDLHLVRLGPDTQLADVVSWMDWMELDGLRAPAPAEFIGGAHEVPVGHTTYFTVELTPGRYAWIAESTAAQGMVSEFIIE